MANFGAIWTQVVDQLQGMDPVNEEAGPETLGTQADIEIRMGWAYRRILNFTAGDVHAALTRGRFTCHKIIDTARNPAQTSPDPGQEFPGTVIKETYTQQLNTPLLPTDDGDGLYSWGTGDDSNIITITSITARAQSVYANYDVIPASINCPSLSGLLVRLTAGYIGTPAVFGGSGDDGGITDRQDNESVELYTELTDLKNITSVSSLLQINLCDPVGDSNSGFAVVDVCG